jgi:hypothetical protein
MHRLLISTGLAFYGIATPAIADPAVALIVAGSGCGGPQSCYGGVTSIKFESFEECEKFAQHIPYVKTPPGSTHSIPGAWKNGDGYNPKVFAICIPGGKDIGPVQANLRQKGLYNP